jgi:UDP-sugar transporter A1/2/3
MLVPAALYAVQNNLLFIALSNLDSVSYQVLYQSKIATTAFFAWLMLNKHLNRGYVFSFFDR